MNNFDQYDKIEQEILKHTPRQLARRIIELEERLSKANEVISRTALSFVIDGDKYQADSSSMNFVFDEDYTKSNVLAVKGLIDHIHKENHHWHLSHEYESAQNYLNKLEKGEI